MHISFLYKKAFHCGIAILAFLSFVGTGYSYGQFTEKPIETLLRAQYEKDVDSEKISGYHRIKDSILVFEKSQEVFPGYFKDRQLFSVIYTSTPRWGGIMKFPKLYLFDFSQNKVVRWVSLNDFLALLNSSEKHISNLDKCYLYLYLYYDVMIRHNIDITKPNQYAENIYTHSQFLNQPLLYTFFKNDPYNVANLSLRLSLSPDSTKQNIFRSSEKRIIIFTYKYSSPEEYEKRKYDYTYRHTFVFDDNYKLYKVETDLFD